MAKEKSVSSTGLILAEMFQAGSYKRNQGRTVRMVTAVAIGVVFGLISWRLYETIAVSGPLKWAIPSAVLLLGLWFSYRIINLPRFADFLIAVEAEMTKVSWPTQTELIRSSVVVIFLIFALAGVLFGFDMFWQYTFRLLGILN